MEKLIFPGKRLAVAKLATNSNDTWAICPGATGEGGPCGSKTETKATFSVARTLAAMARLDDRYGSSLDTEIHYELAKTALNNAETSPFVCRDWTAFGGEGGYYPNNDNYSLWRNPEIERDPCATGPKADPKDNNTNDDHYAAMVELYIAAVQFGFKVDAAELKKKIEVHPHHLRIDQFFFGAVSTEATLSLLANRPKGMDLTQAEENVFAYADKVVANQQVGYPGVTIDVKSIQRDARTPDDTANNFRVGSTRLHRHDAPIVLADAELNMSSQEHNTCTE